MDLDPKTQAPVAEAAERFARLAKAVASAPAESPERGELLEAAEHFARLAKGLDPHATKAHAPCPTARQVSDEHLARATHFRHRADGTTDRDLHAGYLLKAVAEEEHARLVRVAEAPTFEAER